MAAVFIRSLFIFLTFQIIKARLTNKDLVNFINELNKDENSGSIEKITETLEDHEKEEKLKQILQLWRQNYDAKKRYEGLLNYNKKPRLFFINNPEVLDDYQKYLTEKKKKKENLNIYELKQLRRNNLVRRDKDKRHFNDRDARKPKSRMKTRENGNFERDTFVSNDRKPKKERKNLRENESKHDIITENLKQKEFKKITMEPLYSKERDNKKTYKTEKKPFVDYAIKNNWDSYVPKLNYNGDRYRKPKYNKNRIHSQGRTPIPFIGKRDIYEDKANKYID